MGPVLNEKVKKPTVLAPGAQVCSAMNKLHPGFDEKNWMISEKVKVNGGRLLLCRYARHFYGFALCGGRDSAVVGG